jgi:osmoprotectant transport system permease protein
MRADGTTTRDRGRPDTVGITAAVVGLSALSLLPFLLVRSSRIATGKPLALLAALGPTRAALLLGLFALLGLASLRGAKAAPWAVVRGLTAVAAVLGIFVMADQSALGQIATGARFARVSLGGGAWVALLAAMMMIVAVRRELEGRSILGWLILLAAPAGMLVLLATGQLDALGVVKEYQANQERFAQETVMQLVYAATAVSVATVLGVTLGIVAFRFRRFERPIFWMVNMFQTIPGLALIGLLIAPLTALSRAVPALRAIGISGTGFTPVIIVLTLYALLAIVRNTYTGLRAVPEATVDAGAGMGMTERQLMTRVRLPLAAPVLFGGIRTSAVQTVGNATIAAFIGAGGLGLFIFQGLAQQSPDLVLLGSLAVVALALITDGLLRIAQRLLSPRRRSGGSAP